MGKTIFTETITAQNSSNQGKIMKLNSIIHQPEVLADPEVVQDLLYVPKESDRVLNFAYTYGNVRFENGLDGETIRWFVNGTEMPPFICQSTDEFVVIGKGLASAAATYYGNEGANPLNN